MKPVILYFINSGVPTEQQRAEAESFPVKPAWRNTQYIEPEDAVEECGAVAGDVPEQYAHLPGPDKVIKAYNKELKKRREIAGDVPAPGAAKIEVPPDEETAPPANVGNNETEAKNPAIKPAWGANK